MTVTGMALKISPMEGIIVMQDGMMIKAADVLNINEKLCAQTPFHTESGRHVDLQSDFPLKKIFRLFCNKVLVLFISP